MSTDIKEYLTKCGFGNNLQKAVLDSIDLRLFETNDEVLIPTVDSMIEFANKLTELSSKDRGGVTPPWGRTTDKPLELRQVEALEAIAESLRGEKRGE